MNALIVGSDKEPILQYLPERFLLIDDGPLIDALDFPPRRTVTVFDPAIHSFNPLRGMDYLRARDFIHVLNAVFPEGENTLTKRNANFQILEALLSSPRKLETLIKDTKETQYAYQTIQELLLSPVLKDVLTRPTNISFKGTMIVRLDRAAHGDFVCMVLANFFISQYAGTVALSDFGFYAHKGHKSLIRQNRLIAGVTSFDEVPELKSQLLMIEKKIGSRCTPDDAEILALYAGIPKGTNDYNDFIHRAIRPA